jgi:uncharacterized coiled-coil protein SlyX
MNLKIVQKIDSDFFNRATKAEFKEVIIELLNLVAEQAQRIESLEAQVNLLKDEISVLKGEKKSRNSRIQSLMDQSPGNLLQM